MTTVLGLNKKFLTYLSDKELRVIENSFKYLHVTKKKKKEHSEAVSQRCSVNSQENTCSRVFLLIKRLWHRCFCRETWNSNYEACHVTTLYSKKNFWEEIRSVEYQRHAWKVITVLWRCYTCIKYRRYYCTYIPQIL